MASKEVQNPAPTTTLDGNRSPRATTRIWLWLSGPIAFLVAIAAGVAFLIDDLYRDSPVNAAQAVGQDLITLVVALPVLAVCAILAARGFRRAHMVCSSSWSICAIRCGLAMPS